MSVAIVGRTEERLKETIRFSEHNGARVLAFPADVTDRQVVERLVDEVERDLGPIDLLINCAGVFRAVGAITDIDPDAWWREVEINLRGPFLCSWAVLPGMIRRQRGRIINIASEAGLQAIETVSAYSVSKTALIRLTENLAVEFQNQGIAVFAIHPGTVRTPMSDYVHDSPEVGRDAPFVQQWFQSLYRENLDAPIDRSVQLVLSLAAGKADVLSGCFLDIDDDLETIVQNADMIQRDQSYKLRLRN
jgi:NAD(P)-dependent dehydrogenase (short-subunit alcohol dehydrogenase family)